MSLPGTANSEWVFRTHQKEGLICLVKEFGVEVGVGTIIKTSVRGSNSLWLYHTISLKDQRDNGYKFKLKV